MNNNAFFKKDNLLFVFGVFKDYMEETYGVNIDKIEDPNITRRKIFDFMSEINLETEGKNVKTTEKNVMLLSRLKQFYTRQLQLSDKPERKPNIQNLSRDKDIYGNRQVVLQDKRPEIDPYTRRIEPLEANDRIMLDKLQAARNEEVGLVKKQLDTRVVQPLEKDEPESQDAFNRRMQELEKERNATALLDPRLAIDKERNDANDVQLQDPKAIFADMFAKTETTVNRSEELLNNRQEILIPRNQVRKNIPKYLSINSFDRNIQYDAYRYKYTVSFQNKDNDIMSLYKNIESITVSKIIIPEEVLPSNSIVNNVKTAFNHEFSFSYPYLLLSFDEFQDVYDGTNQYARKAFATMIYDRHYKSPNGRGFIILKPIQKEKKTFYPNLLASLPKLTISITKPDGQLLNKSADNYKICKAEYEAFNPQYLKIVTDVYFDKNEFYVGDMLSFSGHGYVPQTPPHPSSTYVDFTTFINRKEGHEIKQIGSPNDNGYYKTFYIDAPGYFDVVQGKYIVNMTLIEALNAYNAAINWTTNTATNGYILNNSLQNTVCLKLETIVDDSRIIHQQIL